MWTPIARGLQRFLPSGAARIELLQEADYNTYVLNCNAERCNAMSRGSLTPLTSLFPTLPCSLALE